MARKTPSRLELRKQSEALEAQGIDEGKKKATTKKPAAPRAKRTKDKAIARKRLVWVVFNGSMKEEGRFPYDQRAAAEEKIEQLKQKFQKKLYFIQPVKELLGDGKAAPALAAAAAAQDEETKAVRKTRAAKPQEDAEDEDFEEDDDDDDDDE